MRGDIILFGSILIFLFVMWVYTGGPTHPISFAGPYLTPITNFDGELNDGYGGGDSYISDGNSTTGDVLPASQSPFSGKVFIQNGNISTRDVREENIVLRSGNDTDITVTGWQLVSAKTGTQIRIPEGKLEGRGSATAVKLSSGEELVLTTGSTAPKNDTYNFDDTWYAYLGKSRELWRNEDDTITLLDADGKVVDQYQY